MIVKLRLLFLLAALALLGGCATVPGPVDPHDPWEGFNRSMTTFNDNLDAYVMKPLAKGYRRITRRSINNAITNFFNNIDDLQVLLNDLLQLKFHYAAQDLSRLMFNTTVGLFGLIDVATYLDLPKRNEDFGQTLAYWGIPSGPYLVLPFFGPSSVRDGFGKGVDLVSDPVYQNFDKRLDYYGWMALKYIDIRSDLLHTTDLVEDISLDQYIFVREAYFQRRKDQIYDGNPPDDDLKMFEQELLNLQ